MSSGKFGELGEKFQGQFFHQALAVKAHETTLDGEPDQPGRILDTQPLEDFTAVNVERLGADAQFFGDFFSRVALPDELQNLALPGR